MQQFVQGAVVKENGRDRTYLRCLQCGHSTLVYIWSWAGHGKAKCKGCGIWHDYQEDWRAKAKAATTGDGEDA